MHDALSGRISDVPSLLEPKAHGDPSVFTAANLLRGSGFEAYIDRHRAGGACYDRAVQVEPYRWRLTPSFVAHLWKAVTQQHHRELLPLLARCVPRDGAVLDVGAHAGQFTKLFARLAANGRVYAIEPGSYARGILRAAIWARRLDNVVALAKAPLG